MGQRGHRRGQLRLRRADDASTGQQVGADRLVRLVDLLTAQAPPYDPDTG